MEAQSVDVQKLRSSNFNSSHPTKLIIHGYNSDMDLYALVDIRKGEYLRTGSRGISVDAEAMLDVRRIKIRIQAEERFASTPQCPGRSTIYPSSYPVGKRISFTGEKMPEI